MSLSRVYLKYIFLFVLTGYLVSCSKNVKIEIPPTEEKIVVNSLFTDSDFFQIQLNRNIHVFSNENSFIENAIISLYENDVHVENIPHIQNGIYVSENIKPKYFNNYRIEIIANDFGLTSATDYLPEKIPIINTSLSDSAYIDIDGNHLSQFSMTFNDPINYENYYLVKLCYEDKIQDDSSSIFYNLELSSNEIIIQNEEILDYYPGILVFSDELFNGKTQQLSFHYSVPEYSVNNEIIDYDYTLFIYLFSISENFYNYQKKLIVHSANQTSSIWDGMGEPVQMFTNIDNGYGIFAGYSYDIDTSFHYGRNK